MNKLPPIPTPPSTINAPLLYINPLLFVALVMVVTKLVKTPVEVCPVVTIN